MNRKKNSNRNVWLLYPAFSDSSQISFFYHKSKFRSQVDAIDSCWIQ